MLARICMSWPQYGRCECNLGPRIISLGWNETNVLSTLLLRRGPVCLEDLIASCYEDPDLEPDWPDDCVRHAVATLRHKLGTNRIVTRWHMGYELVQPGLRPR